MPAVNRAPRLSTLLAGLTEAPLADDPEIHGITLDSRAVQHGWLFIAIPGARADGRAYLAGAYARGAAAAVYETKDFAPETRYTSSIGIKSLREYIGVIASRFYDAPSHKLKVVGVTGTNGKTTTTHMVTSIARAAGLSAEPIGTLSGARTTPEATDLQATRTLRPG